MALSNGQVRVLEALASGPREISNVTNNGQVAGQAVTALVRKDMVKTKTLRSGTRQAVITPEGRKALRAQQTKVKGRGVAA